MIRINSSDFTKMEKLLDTAFKDMDIDFDVEPKLYDFDEIRKCEKLMAFRLSKAFEGATFNIQYKGNKIFDVFITAPFIDGKYIYNADAISRAKKPKYFDMTVELPITH